jgi:hypothetical protein
MPRYGSKGSTAKEIKKGGKKIMPMLVWAVAWPVIMLGVMPADIGCPDALCATGPASTAVMRPLYDLVTLWGIYSWAQAVIFLWIAGIVLITLFEGW